jgi:hypothetical protein
MNQVLRMNYYKYVVVMKLVDSENPEETIVQLGAASQIGEAAIRAIKEGHDLEAVAWAREAATNALDLLGRD